MIRSFRFFSFLALMALTATMFAFPSNASPDLTIFEVVDTDLGYDPPDMLANADVSASTEDMERLYLSLGSEIKPFGPNIEIADRRNGLPFEVGWRFS